MDSHSWRAWRCDDPALTPATLSPAALYHCPYQCLCPYRYHCHCPCSCHFPYICFFYLNYYLYFHKH